MFQRYRALPREVFIATLATIINNLGNVTAPFLTLILSAKLGFSLPLTALVLSLKTLLQMCGVAMGGLASDRFGRKTVIRIGGYLATFTYLLMALFANRPMIVLVLLGVNSIAQATIDPALNALLMDIVPAECQRDASAMKYFGLNLGFSIGPLLAAFLYKNSLPLLFLIDGVTLGIAVFLNEHYIREAYDARHDRKQGFILRDLWDNKALMGFSLSIVLVFVVFFQYNFGLPLALKDVLPQTGELLFGTLMSLNALVVVLFTFLLNHLLQRMKTKSVLMIGMLFYAVGFGLYGMANGAMIFLIGTFIWSLGEILVSTGVNPMIYELVEPSKRGRASAIFPLIRRVAAVLSPLAGGWVLASFGFFGLWLSCVLVIVLALILMKTFV
jgi:MFS family permease